MKTPSKSQKQVITHLSGPVQVIAGPGSGKTFTIIQRILHLMKHDHVRPGNILVITYTKAASIEMKERYEKACAADAELSLKSVEYKNHTGDVVFGTFHSICYHILRQSGCSKYNSLIKESDKRKLCRIILDNHGFSSKNSYEIITDLLNSISRMKNSPDILLMDSGDNRDFSSDELQIIREEYDQYLREQKMFDFDDLITECLKLFSSNPTVCNKYRQIFQYILVDEFQDINSLQYQILKLLAYPLENLMVVGDDDQAIYGFRGATPGIMKQFMEDYRNGTQIFLSENYRSGSDIVQLAASMIEKNKERFVKEFYPVREGGKVTAACFITRREEERRLISEILPLDIEHLSDTAVILRTNREVMMYRDLLRDAGIPVKGKKVSDTDMFHSFIMEDMLSFLSYLYEGGKRRDFICFMNKPNRFISRYALLAENVKREHLEGYYQKNTSMLLEIGRLFDQLKIAAALQPYLSISFFRKTMGYDAYLREKAVDYVEYERFMKQADQVQSCFKNFHGGEAVRRFVEKKADQAGEMIRQMQEEAGVNILTMHGAKGLEFERVFLPDVNDEIIPGKECFTESSLEEERRLLYVAITRAKKELYIYFTKERDRKLSRFLQDIIPLP